MRRRADANVLKESRDGDGCSRAFTRAEDAQAHRAVGNLPFALADLTAWLQLLRTA